MLAVDHVGFGCSSRVRGVLVLFLLLHDVSSLQLQEVQVNKIKDGDGEWRYKCYQYDNILLHKKEYDEYHHQNQMILITRITIKRASAQWPNFSSICKNVSQKLKVCSIFYAESCINNASTGLWYCWYTSKHVIIQFCPVSVLCPLSLSQEDAGWRIINRHI